MKDWCCKWFQRMIDLYPKKGFSIVAFKDESCDYKSFYVTAVPLDQEVRHALKDNEILWPITKDENGNNITLAISTELRLPIAFCPHCGTKLSPLITKKHKEFEMLAKRHMLAEQMLRK